MTLSPYFHGFLPTCLQPSSSASVEVRRKHSYISRRDTEPMPKECLNTSIDASTQNNNLKTHPASELRGEKEFDHYKSSIILEYPLQAAFVPCGMCNSFIFPYIASNCFASKKGS